MIDILSEGANLLKASVVRAALEEEHQLQN